MEKGYELDHEVKRFKSRTRSWFEQDANIYIETMSIKLKKQNFKRDNKGRPLAVTRNGVRPIKCLWDKAKKHNLEFSSEQAWI